MVTIQVDSMLIYSFQVVSQWNMKLKEKKCRKKNTHQNVPKQKRQMDELNDQPETI